MQSVPFDVFLVSIAVEFEIDGSSGLAPAEFAQSYFLILVHIWIQPLLLLAQLELELRLRQLADIELLASADAYIGRFSAALDRLAFALMVARKHGCLPPYASLDSGWCFGEKSAQTLRGDRFDCTEFAA